MSTTTERLETRIDKEQKALLQRAAALTGQSLSNFVISVCYREAVETVERHERMNLTDKDSAIFVRELLADREPSDRLRAAASEYQQMKTS